MINELFSEEIEEFIENHKMDDVAKLRLKYAGDALMMAAILQIELRRKFARKFTDDEGVSLMPQRFPSALSAEQATAATIARFHAGMLTENEKVLDMTMGLGIDSRCFAEREGVQLTSIEKNEELAEYGRRNYASLKKMEIITGDSVEWLRDTDRQFDQIFIDPARRDASGGRVYNIHDCTPDVAEIMPLLLSHSEYVMVKLSPMLDVTATLKDLPHCIGLMAVQTEWECREIFALCQRDAVADNVDLIPISVVDADGNFPEFFFTREEELNAEVRYEKPEKGDYLYEPCPAAMKAGCYKSLADRFELMKLHPNTHLYFQLSDEEIARIQKEENLEDDDYLELLKEFPGKRYRVEAVLPFSSGVIKRFARTYGDASVAVRNFDMSADKLRAKLCCGESAERRVIATTLSDGKPYLLLVEKV